LVFLCGLGLAVFKLKLRVNALILVGISLLFFNVLLNAFALSDIWGPGMAVLVEAPVGRHIIVGFFGCILVVAGLFSLPIYFRKGPSTNWLSQNFCALLFAGWFMGVGWISYAVSISRDPVSPMVNNSQWQYMAKEIDADIRPLCVPIDPWVNGKIGYIKEAVLCLELLHIGVKGGLFWIQHYFLMSSPLVALPKKNF
jgi:hypothetical protein